MLEKTLKESFVLKQTSIAFDDEQFE